MRNKRALGILLIFIVVLLLGVGYALSANLLTITGTAEAKATDENFTVRFKKLGDGIYQDPTDMKNATATIISDTEAKISVTGLKKANDEATVTYTVENVSNGIDAAVLADVLVDNTDYFEVTVAGISTNSNSKTMIVSGNETKVTLKVKLLKTPIADQNANITVKLTAKAVEQ